MDLGARRIACPFETYAGLIAIWRPISRAFISSGLARLKEPASLREGVDSAPLCTFDLRSQAGMKGSLDDPQKENHMPGKDKGTKETKKAPAMSPKEKKKAKDAKKK